MSARCTDTSTVFLDCENGIEKAAVFEAATAGNASGGKTAPGAGLCCCDEAAGNRQSGFMPDTIWE